MRSGPYCLAFFATIAISVLAHAELPSRAQAGPCHASANPMISGFEAYETKLNPTQEDALNAFVEKLETLVRDGLETGKMIDFVAIHGYADRVDDPAIPDPTQRRQLEKEKSKARADAAKIFLEKRIAERPVMGQRLSDFIPPASLVPAGKGKDPLLCENPTMAERAQNRRVEFEVVFRNTP